MIKKKKKHLSPADIMPKKKHELKSSQIKTRKIGGTTQER